MTSKSLLLPAAKNRSACVLYATNDLYAVAVLVAIKRLKDLGIASDIDIVVLHYKVSGYILNAMHKLGILTASTYPPLLATHHFFRDSLLKLRVFQLSQYERIVFLDADSLPLTNLKLLFEVKFNESIAMPRAYWLPEPWTSSALMVAHPSVESWQRLVSWLGEVVRKRNIPSDMEALNLTFQSQIRQLPGEYLCLNGDWGDSNFVPAYGEPEAALERVQLIHFTDLGKPWSYHPLSVRRLRPNARRRYYEFWRTWWAIRDDVCKAASGRDRFAYTFLKYRGVFENLPRSLFGRFVATTPHKNRVRY